MNDAPQITPRRRNLIFENLKQNVIRKSEVDEMILGTIPQITPRRRNLIFGENNKKENNFE